MSFQPSKTIPKDPDAVWPAKVDLKAYTNGSSDEPEADILESAETITTIVTVLVDPASELTVDSSSITDSSTSVTVWLSGGLPGKRYLVTVRVTTSSGRTEDFPFYVAVRK